MSASLPPCLASREVLVCVGSGGVGKTTVSAALALSGALMGSKSLVCTVDPAQRLAQALGLQRLGNQEIPLRPQALAQASLPVNSFWAMSLDMKHAWDELISRHASQCQKTHILNNRFYQSLSSALAGSQEYIAIEKLWELKMHRDYGLLVLDTPPIANAVDFLDAPSRLLGFLDTRLSQHLFLPMLSAGHWGLRVWKASNSLLLKTLSRFTGVQTLEQLAQFLASMAELYEGFKERARQTQELLQQPSTAFVVVTTPQPEKVAETLHFLEVLKQRQLHVAAVVVNQTCLPLDAQLLQQLQALPPPLAHKLKSAFDVHAQQALAHERSLSKLQKLCRPVPLIIIPMLYNDGAELERLWLISQTLQVCGHA